MTRWWEHPKLWKGEDEVGERRVGFLDLFYDLIFVVAIAQIAHGLAAHPDRSHLGAFLLLLMPLFWTWLGHTFYCDRFENRDLSHMAYTFVSMLPILGMAVFAHDGRGETAFGFIMSYVAARSILVFMYLRASLYNESGRAVWNRLAAGFTVGASLWVASAFVDGTLRVVLQVLGLAIDMLVPVWLRLTLIQGLPNFADGRLKERLGLIMIIVLGESIAGTAGGLAEVHDLGWRQGLTALFAMVFAFGLFFTYYEMVPRQRLKPGATPNFLRNYLHFPLLLAVTATGAGVLATVGHEDEVLPAAVRQLLAFAIACAYLSMVALSRVHQYPGFGAGRKGTEGGLWIGIALASGIGLFATSWGSLQVLGVLALVSFLPPLAGILAWRKLTKNEPKQPEAPVQF